MTDNIFNGERGDLVRAKLNEVIDRTNALMGVENHGSQGGNPHGTKASQVTQTNAALGANVQTALDELERKQSADNSNNNSHSNNQNNPHNVKAEQVSQSNPDLGDDVQEALNDLHGTVVELVEMLPEKADLDHIDGLDTHIQLRRGTNPLEAWNDDLMVAELFFHYTKGQLWSKLNDGTTVLLGSQKFIEDAPKDGYTYGREDGQWVRVGATEVGDDRPENPVVGTLWYDTGHTAELYVYDGAWVSVTGGNGGFGEGGELPDNIVLDDAPELLQNVALAREIDSNGDGVWRQITTSDLVTENNQPMFRDSGGRFTTSDEGVIRNQQQANWYLRDRITEGVEKQDELENKVKALEGAVGEHSLLFTVDEASGPQFFITDGMSKKNRLSEASFITLPEVDRNGSAIAIDRISQGDVLRMGDGFGEFAELRINGEPEGNTFPYNQIGGDMDRLTGSIPYDFTVFVAFDPAGLATTDYVDAQDDKRISKSGDQMAGRLSFAPGAYIDSSTSSSLSDRASLEIRVGAEKPLAITSGSSYKEILAFYGYDGEAEDKREKVAYINAKGAAHFSSVTVGEDNEPVAINNVTTWKYVDSTSPKDGEFSFKEANGKVTLIIGNNTSDGILWVHGHGREDYLTFDDSFFVSVSQSNGEFNLISDASDFEFSRKGKSHTHVALDDSEWEIGLVLGQRYCIRIPGLLPLVKF